MYRLTLLSLLGLTIVDSPMIAGDPQVTTWKQWRGPHRDGKVTGPAWPSSLKGEALTQVWKVTDLGPSYSGPIVTEQLVITTESTGEKIGNRWKLKEEVVKAFDRKTGQLTWSARWEGSMEVPFFAARNGSWIRSTPACDDDTVYVAGMRDVLVALSLQDGKEKWRFDFPAELKSPLPPFGFVCSPLVDDVGVYVQAGGAFVKLDKKSGKILWKTLDDKGGMMGSAFSSPVFAKMAKRDQIVVQTREKLAGVDRTTGEVLWSKPIPSFRGMNILTPLPYGDAIFTSTYGGNTRLLNVKLSESGNSTSDVWTFRYEGNMTSPVIVNDHVYLQGKDRRFICFDLKSGQEKWRSDQRFGEYWNLVANGDKILALDNRGILFLIRANPEKFELLDQREVAQSETWAHLAICGDEIYIRSLSDLIKFRWK